MSRNISEVLRLVAGYQFNDAHGEVFVVKVLNKSVSNIMSLIYICIAHLT